MHKKAKVLASLFAKTFVSIKYLAFTLDHCISTKENKCVGEGGNIMRGHQIYTKATQILNNINVDHSMYT